MLELLVIITTKKTCSLIKIDAGQDRIEEIRGESGRKKRKKKKISLKRERIGAREDKRKA